MSSNTPTTAPIPYQLRIGVTGHRDLTDAPAVYTAVKTLLESIDSTLKSATALPSGPNGPRRSRWEKFDRGLARALTAVLPMVRSRARQVPPERQTPLRWTVVSPLAKGADRVVARAALDAIGAELEVLTPFPLDHYERDFEDPEDLAEFRALHARASRTQELSGNEARGSNEARDASDQHVGYLSVGLRVIESCELLIAVLDESRADSTAVGSTAQIVRIAQERGARILWVNAKDPSLPVRFWNGRAWDDLPTDVKTLSLGFHRFSAYNRDPAQRAPIESKKAADLSARTLTAARDAGLDPAILEPLLAAVRGHFGRADHLAVHYQSMYTRSAGLLHALPALAVVAVVVQQLFFPSSMVLIAVEAGLMILALVLLRVGGAESWHEKWLNDRHLAERIRTLVFTWMFKQIDDATRPNALPFYHGPEGWIDQAIHTIVDPVERPDLTDKQFEGLKRFILDAWVIDQSKWHANTGQKRSRRERRLRHVNVALFVATLGAACAHLLGIGHLPDGSSSFVGKLLTMLAITGPAIAASVYGYRELLDLGRIAERSAMMSQVLAQYAARIEETSKIDHLRREVSGIEELVLSENQEWLSSLTFRELTLVT